MGDSLTTRAARRRNRSYLEDIVVRDGTVESVVPAGEAAVDEI